MAQPVSLTGASIARMEYRHFTPWSDEPRRCWHCADFGGMLYGGAHARCLRPGLVPIVAQPANGCAFYCREPGADDEPGPPAPQHDAGLSAHRAFRGQIGGRSATCPES